MPNRRMRALVAGLSLRGITASGIGVGDGHEVRTAYASGLAPLAAIGLPGVLLGPMVGGPAYRLTGRRRLARLAELVGPPPAAVPPGIWPMF